MSDSAATAEEPESNTSSSSLQEALDAEAVEEQHLDDRHATGEHDVSEKHATTEDLGALAGVYEDDPYESAADNPELDLGRGIDNI
ncbi:hypothetical protein [Mycetocola sp. 2940]|uniref:hypothetical protein n=1 Tax=Mycetocola sp. 2940 TaxID=3156452 RepID=UPI0033914F53